MFIIESENFSYLENMIRRTFNDLSIDDRVLAIDIFDKIHNINKLMSSGFMAEQTKLQLVLSGDDVGVLTRCVEVLNDK